MPVFRYKAFKNGGKRIAGRIEAASSQEARHRLRLQGLVTTHLNRSWIDFGGSSFDKGQLLQFTLQLSQLIQSGLPIFESLSVLEEQARGEAHHRVLAGICEKIQGGANLSGAMADYPTAFDPMYRAMVSAGEAAGTLGSTMEQLHHYLKQQNAIKQNLLTAMIYPAFLASFALIAVVLLLIFMVPALEGALGNLSRLGTLTKTVLAASHFMREYWWFYLPFLLFSILGIIKGVQTAKFQNWWHHTLMKTPGLKTLATEAAMARFCTTMKALLMGGLPLVEALRIGKRTMKNPVLEEILTQSEKRIIEGSSLSRELKREKLFPPMLSRMIAVGEESGTLPDMFGRIGDLYAENLKKTLERLTSLAQPVILIFMAGIIGTIMLALLLPLMDVSAFTQG